MNEIRIILQTNKSENPKAPAYRIAIPPVEGSDQWFDVGALWPAKSGNGHSGRLDLEVLREAVASHKEAPSTTEKNNW